MGVCGSFDAELVEGGRIRGSGPVEAADWLWPGPKGTTQVNTTGSK